MQKMGGWHQNRNRHPGVRLDHSGSFRNAHRGRGGYGTGIHTAEGAIPKWLRLSYELGLRSLRFSAVALSPIMASESGVRRRFKTDESLESRLSCTAGTGRPGRHGHLGI